MDFPDIIQTQNEVRKQMSHDIVSHDQSPLILLLSNLKLCDFSFNVVHLKIRLVSLFREILNSAAQLSTLKFIMVRVKVQR